MANCRVIQAGEHLEGEALGTGPETGALADMETAVGLGAHPEPAVVEAAVQLRHRRPRPLKRPTHPGCDCRRRGRVTQAHDQRAAAAGIVAFAIGGWVLTGGGWLQEGDKALS